MRHVCFFFAEVTLIIKFIIEISLTLSFTLDRKKLIGKFYMLRAKRYTISY